MGGGESAGQDALDSATRAPNAKESTAGARAAHPATPRAEDVVDLDNSGDELGPHTV